MKKKNLYLKYESECEKMDVNKWVWEYHCPIYKNLSNW